MFHEIHCNLYIISVVVVPEVRGLTNYRTLSSPSQGQVTVNITATVKLGDPLNLRLSKTKSLLADFEKCINHIPHISSQGIQ